MNLLFFFINAYIFLTIILMFYILAYALPKKGSPITRMVGLLTAFSLVYVLGYLIEINASTLALKYFWNYVQYLAIPFLPAVWLMIALMHRYDRVMNKEIIGLILVIPIITFLIRLTNDFHSLYYTDYFLVESNDLTFMALEVGFIYHLQSIYLVFAIIYANILYFSNYLKRQGLLKKTAFKLFLVSLFPMLGHIANVFLTPLLPIDYVVLVSPISISFLALVLKDDYFTSIKPLARNQIFLKSETGTIVFNQLFEVIDFNPKAQAILKNLSLKGISLTDIKQVYPRFPVDDMALDATFESEKKIYQIKLSSVTSNIDETIGYVMRLTDITTTMQVIQTLKEREEQIKNLVYYDQLTNLYNRHFLESYLKEISPFIHPIVFIFVDMNELKFVNDTLGHQKGDELLVHLATIILKTSPKDAKPIRLGGDEFLIMCPNQDDAFAKTYIKTFKEETAQYEHLSVAMGYAIKEETDHFNQVYKEAEDDMYQDKAQSKKISK